MIILCASGLFREFKVLSTFQKTNINNLSLAKNVSVHILTAC